MSDPRRNQRAVTIAAAMATNPAQSIPQMFLNSYDAKAAYNLFQHPEATPDNLQQSHREVVLEQLYQAGRYLLIEDTSEITVFTENDELTSESLMPGFKCRVGDLLDT